MTDNSSKRYACVCCGAYTMREKPPGTYEICPVCGWEDDPIQFRDPDFAGGANEMSLNEARTVWNKQNIEETKSRRRI